MSPPAQLRWHPSLWRAEIPPRAPIAVSAAFRGCVNCHKNVSLSVWRGALTRKSGYSAKEASGRCFLLLFAFFFSCFFTSFPFPLLSSFDLDFLLQKGESPPATTPRSPLGHEEKSRARLCDPAVWEGARALTSRRLNAHCPREVRGEGACCKLVTCLWAENPCPRVFSSSSF